MGLNHKLYQSVEFVRSLLGRKCYRFRGYLSASGEVQSGGGLGRFNDPNSHEAVTTDFESDQAGSLPDNSFPPSNKLHLFNFRAGEELVISYIYPHC